MREKPYSTKGRSMVAIKLKSLDKQIVVIFGASSGIGRLAALRFAEKGAHLTIVGRKEEALESLLEEITVKGGKAIAFKADTTKFEEVKKVAEKTVQYYGRIDTWVHVAGVGIYSRFIDLSPQEFKQAVDVNLLGQVHGAMAALPYLRKNLQGSALIHISSIAAEIGLPFQSAYSAAKQGVKGFLDVLRLELQHDMIPISVTNIMPAAINTPFFSHAFTKLGVLPRAFPPVYPPEKVVEIILKSAIVPTKNIVVGRMAKWMVIFKKIMPAMMNLFLLKKGFTLQMSQELKKVDEPSELFQPNTQDARIYGGFKTKDA